jgi:hypothetical protein
MTIPALNSNGWLPTAIHDCTLVEVRQSFGSFQGTDRRVRLMERLDSYIEEIRSTQMVDNVMIDGSFVTGTAEPNDIDLIVVLSGDHDFSVSLRPFEYNVLSRRQVRKHYGFDVSSCSRRAHGIR